MITKGLTLKLFVVLFLTALLLFGQNVIAAEVTMDIDGGNGVIVVDDHGGDEANNEISWDGSSHTSSTFLAVFDSITGDLDNAQIPDYKGVNGDDRNDTWANSQSGIMEYAAPVDGMPACVGSVAAAPGGDPSVPVSFEGANTGLTVEQFVYSGANAPFAIHEYIITNNTQDTKNIKVAHFNDFDVFSGSDDDDMGYDAQNKLVWQWDDAGYIAGMALLRRGVSNYFLEFCCTLSSGDTYGYDGQMGFFTNDPDFNGAKAFTPGDDLEVDIAANVGALQPGRSARVAFAVAAADGGTSAAALTNLRETIAAARQCYNKIRPPQVGDDDNWPCFISTIMGNKKKTQ